MEIVDPQKQLADLIARHQGRDEHPHLFSPSTEIVTPRQQHEADVQSTLGRVREEVQKQSLEVMMGFSKLKPQWTQLETGSRAYSSTRLPQVVKALQERKFAWFYNGEAVDDEAMKQIQAWWPNMPADRPMGNVAPPQGLPALSMELPDARPDEMDLVFGHLVLQNGGPWVLQNKQGDHALKTATFFAWEGFKNR